MSVVTTDLNQVKRSNIILQNEPNILTENPRKFATLFWNTQANEPSDALKKLIEILLPDLPLNSTLNEIVQATQKAWLQTKRWEVKTDTPKVQELRSKIQPILNDLKLTSSSCPSGHYDTALLLAGRANIFLARCYSLCKAVEEKKITLSQIDILAGNQPLHPLELEILQKCSFAIENVKTEKEMAEVIANKILKPLNINCNIIVTDLKEKKPSTEQTVTTWLESADQSGKKALVVSDPQFAVYQYFQCMESIYKKETKDICLDLLSQQLDPNAFKELSISLEETQESPILLYLDTITRLLYTLESQINRGFIK